MLGEGLVHDADELDDVAAVCRAVVLEEVKPVAEEGGRGDARRPARWSECVRAGDGGARVGRAGVVSRTSCTAAGAAARVGGSDRGSAWTTTACGRVPAAGGVVKGA